MQGDKPNYFQGHRICMDQNNSLQLNKSQLNSFTKTTRTSQTHEYS